MKRIIGINSQRWLTSGRIKFSDMKVYVRNRHKNIGPPDDFFAFMAFQACLWFKPEGKETRADAFDAAKRFAIYLRKELRWSTGALGKIAPHPLSWNGVEDTDSVGIQFGHRLFADEAKELYKRREGHGKD